MLGDENRRLTLMPRPWPTVRYAGLESCRPSWSRSPAASVRSSSVPDRAHSSLTLKPVMLAPLPLIVSPINVRSALLLYIPNDESNHNRPLDASRNINAQSQCGFRPVRGIVETCFNLISRSPTLLTPESNRIRCFQSDGPVRNFDDHWIIPVRITVPHSSITGRLAGSSTIKSAASLVFRQ